MTHTRKAALLAVAIAVALAVPGAATANTGVIRAAGSAYIGPVNLRLVAGSNVTLTTSGGAVTCTSATTGLPGPRLAGWGEGSTTNSAIATTLTTNGTISNMDFGNPLRQVSAAIGHDTTTAAFTPGTPMCPSTIPAISGGCVARGTGTSTNPYNVQTQWVAGSPNKFKLSINIPAANPIQLRCLDGAGAPVNCSYASGASTTTPGPITSDLISFNTGGSTAASTARFTSQSVYRASGSSLCHPTAKFNTSVGYQIYTGQVYPGGDPVYATSNK